MYLGLGSLYVVTWLMMALFGFPNIPCRGSACFAINEVILTSSIVAMVLLICYVVDVTLLCRRWVNSYRDEQDPVAGSYP